MMWVGRRELRAEGVSATASGARGIYVVALRVRLLPYLGAYALTT
jgi:hypothetical protein